ncbi:LamG-like jellyroll fold domain-containing protein [Algibacter mikhailovii]|uniref:Secretion system C-terminal sorting domain-containing protein n=1 Tax=Algibacter mikhailovii TaxID=425498 RepID=A0A918R705_9FLAO|nr:LamG-like jellyroll fold domain-containing protein [Algibacter mikhailovii]GGZ86069.1 hypothetical protein GCM10007028_25470 [Algibacter mikhailovii]
MKKITLKFLMLTCLSISFMLAPKSVSGQEAFNFDFLGLAGTNGIGFYTRTTSGTFPLLFQDLAESTMRGQSGNFTWQAWVKSSTSESGNVYSEGGFGKPEFSIKGDGTGKLKVFFHDAAGPTDIVNVNSATTVFDDTWHHIALVGQVNGGTFATELMLYIDGVMDATINGTPNYSIFAYATDRIAVGNYNNFGDVDGAQVYANEQNPYKGEMALFRAYRKARTLLEISGDSCEAIASDGTAVDPDLRVAINFSQSEADLAANTIKVVLVGQNDYSDYASEGTIVKDLTLTGVSNGANPSYDPDLTAISFTSFSCQPLSTADFAVNQVSIYRHANYLYVKTKKSIAVANMKLTSLLGQIVKSDNTDNLDISTLSPGVYIVSVNLKNGTGISKKIIIK